jgi:4-hydroxy-2-oxoheptanedioate aldolase
MHPVLEEAIDRIHAAAVANGKRSGIYCTDPEQARKYALKGFHMISVFADVSALTTALSNGLSTARHGETGEARLSGPYGK